MASDESDASDEPADSDQPAASDETIARAPTELQCVSAATSEQGEMYPSVWRATLYSTGETTGGTFSRGPLFQSHAGVWGEADTQVISVEQLAVDLDGALRFTAESEPQVSLELAAQGLFFFGTLALDGDNTEVVCWDRIALFGSSWAPEPERLPARYDAGLGRCTDRDGAPAVNVLPLEFVLETRYGDCADLRGVRLQGDDYANPDLTLNLRGADLAGAKLHFANLSGSFEGARMAAFDFGYARISGTADDWTELHESCEVTESPWAGTQLTCIR
jgi:hypothetical protein